MIWSIFGGKAEAKEVETVTAPQRFVWVVHFRKKIQGVTRGHRHALVVKAATQEGARLEALKQVRLKAGYFPIDEEISHVAGGSRKA